MCWPPARPQLKAIFPEADVGALAAREPRLALGCDLRQLAGAAQQLRAMFPRLCVDRLVRAFATRARAVGGGGGPAAGDRATGATAPPPPKHARAAGPRRSVAVASGPLPAATRLH